MPYPKRYTRAELKGKMKTCANCKQLTRYTYDGGYCEDCAIDNLPTGSGRTVKRD